MSDEQLYREDANAGRTYREQQLEELQQYIQLERERATAERLQYFAPDFSSPASYAESVEVYRQAFVQMLGHPLTVDPDTLPDPTAQVTRVAEDPLGEIFRVEVDAGLGLTTYGLLMLPRSVGPCPLVISQHGGGGTPELCSGFVGPSNYNDMSRRVLEAGFAVFAPQLLLWDQERFGPAYDRKHIDVQLKQIGGSITALDIFKIRRSIDYLVTREEVDGGRIGMIGLSYGGFYTMFTAAVDLRIGAAVSSCFFNDRFVYDWSDWTWFEAGRRFLDPEVCGLICPRPLYLEIGEDDDLLAAKHARAGLKTVQSFYDRLRLSDLYTARVFPGGHELDPSGENIAFLKRHLG